MGLVFLFWRGYEELNINTRVLYGKVSYIKVNAAGIGVNFRLHMYT